ncbi:MAG: hypothetical protein RIM99_08940 [Cyclobacteriaceae bacterium]
MKSFKIEDTDKGKQPFSVPDGYFEKLPMQIQSRIEAEKKPVLLKMPALRVAFAAAAILTIVLTVVFIDQPRTPEEMLAGISQEDLLAYIDLSGIEESDIYAVFDSDIDDLDFTDTNELDELQLEDDQLDDILIEYDLSDEYL